MSTKLPFFYMAAYLEPESGGSGPDLLERINAAMSQFTS